LIPPIGNNAIASQEIEFERKHNLVKNKIKIHQFKEDPRSRIGNKMLRTNPRRNLNFSGAKEKK
jgi:hypothetical protein